MTDQTVRLPGDKVRHDVYILREDMHARFDDMSTREDEAHAAIGQRIGIVEDRQAQVEAKLDSVIAHFTAD